MSVYNIIAVATVGVCTGIFNWLLAQTGYIAPSIVDGLTVAAVQPDAVRSAITFSFVGLEVFTGLVLILLLLFLNVEKTIAQKQAVIKQLQGDENAVIPGSDDPLWRREQPQGEAYRAKIAAEMQKHA